MGSPAATRMLARMGYNDSPFARAERAGIDLRPALPVSIERERRRRERKRQTPSELRAVYRKAIVGKLAALADPENDWCRDGLEFDLGRLMLRYRLALSALQLEVRPELPGEHCDLIIDIEAARGLEAA